MKISAFSMCRNAHKLYYPIEESVRSVLDLVDEFVIAVGGGDQDDRTLEILRGIGSDKIKIIETQWDIDSFPNGTVHAQQTDLAKAHCTGDWLLYLQADEVIHEDDLPRIELFCEVYQDDDRVEGMLFQYWHFWGDYDHIVQGHGWYPKEIRLIRNRPEIHSWESAQSFRVIPDFDGSSYRSKAGTRKLKVVETPIRVYHFGWVRPPAMMTEKMNRLDRIHSHQEERYSGDFHYGSREACIEFPGSHPKVMHDRIEELNWDPWTKGVEGRPKHKHERWKNRLLTWIERRFLEGEPLFSFKNYELLD